MKKMHSKIHPYIPFLLGIFLLFFFPSSYAAECLDIFPDGASNSDAAGDININFGSQIHNSPDNILDTVTLNDFAGAGTSCDGVSCTASGTPVPEADFNSFVTGQADMNFGSFVFTTVSPGTYENFSTGIISLITMEPGDYIFNGNFSLGWISGLAVDGPGTVRIFVNGTVSTSSFSYINTANGTNYVFIYSRSNITIGDNSTNHAVIYSEANVQVSNGATLTGAITAEGDVSLVSSSDVTYSSSAISNMDFDTFCDPPAPPSAVAEWRLDEFEWDGDANEVEDNSGNGLHGNAVLLGDYPTTDGTSPAITGNPGTCYYGEFDGTSDGYVQIADPGTGSLLDLPTSFTVAAWIYPTAIPGSGLYTIVSKDTNFEFHINSSGRIFWWWQGGSVTSTSSVTLNTWQHVAITYTSGSQTIYLNGVSVGTGGSTTAITVNNDPLFIGTDLNVHSRRFNGRIDEVKVYDSVLTQAQVTTVMNETHTCDDPAMVTGFTINIGSGTASTCLDHEVTISVLTAGNLFTSYVGTINLSTSTNNGDWSKTADASEAQGTLTPGASDSGAASYEFEQTELDQGTITLDLSNQHAESLTITVEDATAGVSATSATLTFSENAFVISSIDSLGDDVVAGRSHDFQAQMIRNDTGTGSCGAATNYNVSDVKAWITRDANDPGGAAPQVTNSGSSDTESLGNSEPVSNNFTLPFVNGVANFSLQTTDVGRYTIQFHDDSASFSDQDIDGGSSVFTVRPFGFDVQVTGNNAATSAAGAASFVAGSSFTVNATAKAWALADDADDNGIPDNHDDTDPSNNANLSDNSTVVSYGSEGSAENIELSAYLILPAGGSDPGLSSSTVLPDDGREMTSAGSGVFSTSDVNYSEVGIIEISAAVLDDDYLNAGTTFTSRAVSKSGYVGRFYPDSFSITPTSITAECTPGLDYSYMGENFSVAYQVDALNTSDVLTTNYRGSFVKLNAGSGSVSIGAIDAGVPTPLSSRVNVSGTVFSWGNGSGNLTTTLSIDRDSSVDGPYSTLDIGGFVTDSDSVTVPTSSFDLDVDNNTSNDHMDLGQTEVRFGRLRLSDAFGPETAALPVEFVAEYWDGSIWATNVDDSCTGIATSAISYPSGTIDVVANRTVTVGTGTTTGSYGSISGGDVIFSAGDAGHSFSAPGSGNTGSFSVDVDLSLYPWLRYDWNNDGAHTDSALPTATFTFGSYRGNDRVIFWQEVLNN